MDEQYLQLQLPKLPQEIILDILSRLPVKSLMRFRCVKKSWNSLVHDPEFIQLHLDQTIKDIDKTGRRRFLVKKNTSPPCFLCENLDKGDGVGLTMPTDYPDLFPGEDIEIVGSSNGLLCLMVADFTEDGMDCKFILWNPSTRACREVAKPGLLRGYYPDTIPIYGFGYDASVDDYKIIRAVTPYHNTTGTELEIYTLKHNAWRKLQVALPCIPTDTYWRKIEDWFPGIFSRGAGVFTGGAIHWLEKRTVDTHESDLILSFNLATEKFDEVVPLLDFDKGDSNLSELQVIRGQLSVLVNKWTVAETEIWVMKEYGLKGSWTKIGTVPDKPVDDWFVPFHVTDNGRVLIDMDGIKILIYDQGTNTFDEIELEHQDDQQNMFLVEEFVESLVSPFAA